MRLPELLCIATLAAGTLYAGPPRQDPPASQPKDQQTADSKNEEKEESFFSQMLTALEEDMADSESLIKWTPRGGLPRGRSTGDQQDDYKGGEWVFVPIPQSNPTLGTGLALAGGYIYRVNAEDDKSPPAMTGLGGLFTSNNTWGAGGTHQMAWGKDRFRLSATAAYGDINYLFRPSGSDPEDERFSIPINIRGTFAAADFAPRIFEKVFVGPRFTFMDTTTEPFPERDFSPPTDPENVGQFGVFQIDAKTVSLGFDIMRDTRDSLFYPRRGSLATFRASFFDESIGSDFDYKKFEATFSVYQSLGKHHVIAATANLCSVSDAAPFFDLCYLGQAMNLRGYRVGWYQDRTLFAAQAEYRVDLFWRIGLVGFFGVGQVAQRFNEFNKPDWLPGGGFGLRFTVARENRVNLRIDFAWGKDSSATYISGGEAF